ncbi:MAG: CYTH domain-containing protein, partial [Burkholderiaceae bacterium]
RKFLERNDQCKNFGEQEAIRQGNLSSHPDRIVRERKQDKTAMLTIKGRTVGVTRGEWEYPIPIEDAQRFLDDLCEKPIIEKIRHRIQYEGMLWEVDEFFGENQGLVVAEIELLTEDQVFNKPDWVGDEVTHDRRYANANLLRHPFAKW